LFAISDKSVIPMFATKITNKIFTNVFKPNMHNFSNISIILTITDIVVMSDFAKVIGYSFTNCIFKELVFNKVHKVYVLRDFRVYIRSIWHI